jgi:hypothetical protein
MLGAERIGRTTFGLRECEIEEASQIPSLPERPSPPTDQWLRRAPYSSGRKNAHDSNSRHRELDVVNRANDGREITRRLAVKVQMLYAGRRADRRIVTA